jgi:acyl-CoA synthetase (NDP forming)
MTPEQRKGFERLLTPRHIAFIGGTDAIIAIGEARRRGFTGQYWPVNPKRDQMCDLPCFASVDALPEAPDAVFLAIPAEAAVATVEKLAVMGAGGVVCYTAGFKESGSGGEALEQRLKKVVGDTALIGPNCYGVVNYLDDVALWPFAHGGSCPGFGAAIITQSGMFSSDISMSQRSLPLTHLISAGNQAVLGLEDFVDTLCENPAVRAIGVHIEGLADIPKFEHAALKALQHNTPIVALKTGSSEIGSRLTISHTGSMSGAKDLYDALFERTGVISVTNPSQLLETLKYLCIVKPPKGRKIAGFTCSGGGATMLADYAETIGLEFPAFEPQTTQDLVQALPPIATVSNPLDYTTPIWGQPEYTGPVFQKALDPAKVDAAILVQDYPAPGLDESKVYYQNDARAFAVAARMANIPAAICATLPENIDANTRAFLISSGVAPMQGIHETLNAVAQAAEWTQQRQKILASPVPPLQAAQTLGVGQFISEADGKAKLRSMGIPVPSGHISSGDSAPDIAQQVGFPVVLKMMGPKLTHKTEARAVILGLKSPAEVRQAVSKMRASVTLYNPCAVTDIFLVESQAAKPLAEMVIGLRQDPQFGWVLTLGSGGVFVELLEDTTSVLLPVNMDRIAQALERLKLRKLLSGFRGGPVADMQILAHEIAKVCNAVQTDKNGLHELEINPVFIYSHSILAVDVLAQQTVTF